MLNLYFLRHGESGFDAPSDQERVLTKKGVADTSALYADFLAGNVQRFDTVFCSPYQRTQQSCNNVLNALPEASAQIIYCDELVPNSTPEAAAELLYKHLQSFSANNTAEHHILITTHMPLIAYLLAYLVEGEARAASSYAMQPGSCAHLRCELPVRGLAHLQALHHPS
ncbi:MAG: phosphohistidine phosphatase SixA [Sinobacterium sp.]|nr:phosphohistidine phosphatase SixA [Sinobacterium sp.]